MAEFLIELYVARGDGGAAACDTARTLGAAEALSREETPVRLVRSLLVPEDETCYLLVEASSIDLVREVGRRARLQFERVTEVVTPSSEEGCAAPVGGTGAPPASSPEVN